jgi:MoaA/NifB/PqqE/SkfB family radical SAM enzyme
MIDIPIKSIYAVEVSGACNLERTCTWCPMNKRPRYRSRGIMSQETVERSIHWLEKVGANDVLALHVFGEPLLHPKFIEIAAQFVQHCPITMSTNGILLDHEMAKRLATLPWAWISVSPWDPVAMENAVGHLANVGIATMLPKGVTHDWAGTATGPKSTTGKKCSFLEWGKAVIRWDGSVASCCISDREEDALGHVNQEPEEVMLHGYSLCATCHQGGGDSRFLVPTLGVGTGNEQ